MSQRARSLPFPVPRGGRIGVFALSGPVAAERLAAGVRRLEDEGFEVELAPNLALHARYLAGTDGERVAGLEWLLERGVDALVAARGGYGAMRVLPSVPWDRLSRWGGWVVGFSDVTVLHAAAAGTYPFATLLGPMMTTLVRHEDSARRMLAWMRGEAPPFLSRVTPSQVVRGGTACGVAIGGTLSLLASLVGTPYDYDYDRAVLFVEEVGESLYRLDRLLTHLRLSSRLERVQAIVSGRLIGCSRGEVGWRDEWRRLLAEAAPQAVVVEGLPFGHGSRNLSIPLGVEVTVDTVSGAITVGGA
ncbi:MAG: S66 peptidase family protein [Acidobacteriota bacterium]